MPEIPFILLIDEDEVSNQLTQKSMQVMGIESIFFTNGKEGLDYIQSALRWNKPIPTHVFLDIKESEMDGFEFLKKYRSLGFENSGIKIILFTSSVNPRGFNFLKEIGFSEVIVKPLTLDKINQFLNIPLSQA